MNIVMVCESAEIAGGAEKVAVTTAVELALRGFRVGYFAPRLGADPSLHEAGVDVCTAGVRSFWEAQSKGERLGKLLRNPESAAEFAEYLKRFDPKDTVVHLHTFRLTLSGAGVKVALDMGFPVVLTCHDFGASCPTALLFNYRESRPCELRPLSAACWRTECTNTAYKYKAVRQLQASYNYHRARLQQRMGDIIFVSQHSRRVLEPLLNTRARLHLLQYPQDLVELPPVDPAQNAPFLYVGRMTVEKAPELLAEAGRIISAPVRFVGDGPTRPRVLEANPDATLTGWLGSDGVREELRSARALVLTSLWYETAGLSVIDAQSHGIPVIVPDHTASVEFMVPGRTGFTFRSGDVNDLAARMREMQDDATATRMGREAYEWVWANPPSMERHLHGLISIYEGALGARQAKSA